MKRASLLLLVLTLLVAGCASPDADETPPPPSPGDAAARARLLYAPDCASVVPAQGWPEPCVQWASRNPSPSKAEVDVAVNPLDPMNAIVGSKDMDPEASQCVWAVPQVTRDGGRTWKTVYIGGKSSERAPGDPLFGWACITDPIIVFDREGVAYYALQAYNYASPGANPVPGAPVTSGSAIFLARSTDGGETWDHIIPLHAGDGNAAFHDYMRIADNPATGSVYTTWNQVGRATMAPVVVATRDGGETADAPVYVPVPERPGRAGISGLAAGNDGRVHLMLGGFFNDGEAYLASSDDDARTFSVPRRVFNFTPMADLPDAGYRAGSAVELAVDRSGGDRDGRLYAVWADGRAGAGDADILARASADGGATWGEAVRVNRDASRSDQWMPRVTVDDVGTVHVVYATRAYDPEHRLVDAEHAYSTDGGATWTTRRLTTVGSDGDLGLHQDGGSFFGDYIGIASEGGRTYAAFAHTGTGASEVGVVPLVRR